MRFETYHTRQNKLISNIRFPPGSKIPPAGIAAAAAAEAAASTVSYSKAYAQTTGAWMCGPGEPASQDSDSVSRGDIIFKGAVVITLFECAQSSARTPSTPGFASKRLIGNRRCRRRARCNAAACSRVSSWVERKQHKKMVAKSDTIQYVL